VKVPAAQGRIKLSTRWHDLCPDTDVRGSKLPLVRSGIERPEGAGPVSPHRIDAPKGGGGIRACRLTLALALAAVGSAAAGPKVPEIPIEFQVGLIWVNVAVAEVARPLNFLIDTGAQVSAINAGTAPELGLRRGRLVSVKGVRATARGYWPTPLEATVGPLTIPSKVLALDLGALGQACCRPVDGLLGADFFRHRIVQLDFGNRMMRILEQAPFAEDAATVPLRIRRDGMCVPVRLGGTETGWVRLDTGCASALQWVTASTLPAENSRQVAVGLTVLSFPVISSTVRLGTIDFENVSIGLHSEEVFAGESGLLGNGILSRFSKLTIDAKHGRLFLRK
jgi:gag-polyprotein putative aspartyl protease